MFDKIPVATCYSRVILIGLWMHFISLWSRSKDIIVLNCSDFPDCETGALQRMTIFVHSNSSGVLRTGVCPCFQHLVFILTKQFKCNPLLEIFRRPQVHLDVGSTKQPLHFVPSVPSCDSECTTFSPAASAGGYGFGRHPYNWAFPESWHFFFLPPKIVYLFSHSLLWLSQGSSRSDYADVLGASSAQFQNWTLRISNTQTYRGTLGQTCSMEHIYFNLFFPAVLSLSTTVDQLWE